MTVVREHTKRVYQRPRYVPDEDVAVINDGEMISQPTQRVYDKKKTIFRAYQIIWYILGFIEILLIFRFILKFIAANPFSPFVSLVYSLSEPLTLPFSGIIAPIVTGSSVLEWSTLIAAIVYWLIAWGLVELFQLINPVSSEQIREHVDNP